MIEFLVDNIYVGFGGQLFRQMVGIPMGAGCAPLLADLFLYSCGNEFLDKLIKEGGGELAGRFNLSYRYIDDLISFNNKGFKEFISDVYPRELAVSETAESTSVASYLDLLFTRDRGNNMTARLYDRRDAFGFRIVDFPFMSGDIPSAPACGVYASQLVRYARCCSDCSGFLIRHRAGCKVNRFFPTHLGSSVADTLIWLGNARKMSAKCMLILSVEMIFCFDGFANGQINKIS